MTAKANKSAEQLANRELVITRTFDAPREIVFKMWTDPNHMAQWWGPHGFTNPVCELDVRPGGAIRIDMRDSDGTVYPMTGTFREIVRPERLVFTAEALDQSGTVVLEVLNTVILEEKNEKTTLTLQARVTKVAGEGISYLEGMEAGWTGEDDGVKYLHYCKIKEVIPGKKLVYSWRYEGYEGDSQVTFELFAEGNQTRLKLTHEGLERFPKIPAFAQTSFMQGWTQIIGSSLKEFVEIKETL